MDKFLASVEEEAGEEFQDAGDDFQPPAEDDEPSIEEALWRIFTRYADARRPDRLPSCRMRRQGGDLHGPRGVRGERCVRGQSCGRVPDY